MTQQEALTEVQNHLGLLVTTTLRHAGDHMIASPQISESQIERFKEAVAVLANMAPVEGGPIIWQPWLECTAPEPLLPIPEPPCKYCQHWRPARKFRNNGVYAGVSLCRSDEMQPDFSCFQNRQEKNE